MVAPAVSGNRPGPSRTERGLEIDEMRERPNCSGSDDGTVRLWDATTGQPIGQPLTGHTDKVNSIAYSPEGTRLATGSDDKTVRLWPAYPDPLAAMCAKLTTNMSHQQWRDWVSPDIDYIKACPDLPIAPD
jgi:WD40 repeat protein